MAELRPDGQTPAEIVDRILAAITSAGGVELLSADALPQDLVGVDFSPRALAALRGEEEPIWWNADRRGVNLAGADLGNRHLTRANLARADLSGALLDGVHAQQLDARFACLDGASLIAADLSFANLTSADLRRAGLNGAKFWRAAMRNAELSESSMPDAVLSGATLEGSVLDRADVAGASFEGAMLAGASMREVRATRTNFRGADLDGAQLQRCVLLEADFDGARLRGADLTGASLGSASFRDAMLQNAILRDLQLADCDMTGVSLAGAIMDGAEISQRQIGPRVGEETNGDLEGARRAYRGLMRAFADLGDSRSTSWAYRRMRRMQRRQHGTAARAAWSRRDVPICVVQGLRWIRDLLLEWSCDYGDSVGRVMLSMLAVFVVFGLVYAVSGGVVAPLPGGQVQAVRSPLRIATFALTAFLTGGNPGDLQPSNDVVQLLIGIQAFLGIALTGLLGFIVGTKIRDN